MASVSEIAGILSRGEPTPFVFEGALRFHLRVERILGGESWEDADDAAMELIGRALRSLKVYRPKYAEGQPIAFNDLYCRACGTPIVVEDRCSTYHSTYCDDCDDTTLRAVQRQDARADRKCPCCGKRFDANHGKRVYCSDRCTQHAWYLRNRQLQTTRPCRLCGKPFDPPVASQRYCSDNCKVLARRQIVAASYERQRQLRAIGPRPIRAGSAEARDVLPGRLDEPVEAKPANRNRRRAA